MIDSLSLAIRLRSHSLQQQTQTSSMHNNHTAAHDTPRTFSDNSQCTIHPNVVGHGAQPRRATITPRVYNEGPVWLIAARHCILGARTQHREGKQRECRLPHRRRMGSARDFLQSGICPCTDDLLLQRSPPVTPNFSEIPTDVFKSERDRDGTGWHRDGHWYGHRHERRQT